MLPSLREDYLEAILLLSSRHPALPTAGALACALHFTEPEVVSHLAELAVIGDLTFNGQGGILLSDQGKETGQRVIKKHETLQCFLTEILGMDSSQASSEACKIEHAVSDETIDRLGNYLRIPAGKAGGDTSVYNPSCIENGIHEFSRTLADCDEGDRVVVSSISGKSCAKRLLDLGVVPGQELSIKRKLSNRSLVIQVKGCDVALSPEIASAISVERS
jgi:DtxR family Mn-dependent transcriptional regulator